MTAGKRLHALVSGRVQGVWYRASTQKKAQSLGLVGWVRNLTDGRVELVAIGDQDQLQKLLDWCYQGPELAEVKAIEVTWGEVTDEDRLMSDFNTLPTV
jgi:acylphosphatase